MLTLHQATAAMEDILAILTVDILAITEILAIQHTLADTILLTMDTVVNGCRQKKQSLMLNYELYPVSLNLNWLS